jgi:membrane-bound lytic murein transglycosylase D
MKLGLSRIIVVLLAMAAPAAAQQLELPGAGLESRVDFWKKVFTQYGADDVIVHDRFHVNLIYDIASDSDVAARTAAVRQALDEILANLETPEALSLTAKQVRDAIKANGVSISAATLGELRNNIHTQRGIKERFRDGIIRSGRYVENFKQVFENEGLPTDIALLPLVESSFENRALSKAGAAGLWQFTRGTGRLYMKVTRKVDERLDPAKATRAAARLLRDNYKALGSWPVAITAYNHGRAGMKRAQNQAGPEMTSIINNYRGPLFGYASMNFYSEFLAAVEVYKNYEEYFGQLTLDKPSTTRPTVTPTRVAAAPKAAVAKAAAPKPSPADKYKVRKGDTLYEIAQKFGLSLRDLMDRNNLRNSAIHAGQILLVK